MTQQQIEYACKDLVFHFNKGHLTDETIPMWVIKTHGESFYVNHVTSQLNWSTKETPDNERTKGSIKFKECLLQIDPENNATISTLNLYDKIRLRNQKLGITRIMFGWGSKMHLALKDNEFKHSPFKNVEGSCGTSYIICDLLKKEEATLAALKYQGWRIIKPNEAYYTAYDNKGTIWENEELDDDED